MSLATGKTRGKLKGSFTTLEGLNSKQLPIQPFQGWVTHFFHPYVSHKANHI